jgi:hypothetical protein
MIIKYCRIFKVKSSVSKGNKEVKNQITSDFRGYRVTVVTLFTIVHPLTSTNKKTL